MSLPVAACSSACVTQPTVLLTANVGVNIWRGSPTVSMITPA